MSQSEAIESTKKRKLQQGDELNDEDKKEFEIIQGYRDFANIVVQDRAQVTRNGDIGLALQRLEEVDTLFGSLQNLQTNKNAVLAQDSKAMKNISELLSISMSNVKLDESGRLIKLEDVLNGSKKFMLEDYFRSTGISDSAFDNFERNGAPEEESEGQSHDGIVRGEATGTGAYKESGVTANANVSAETAALKQRQQHSHFLSQYEKYSEFNQFNWFKMGMLYQNMSLMPFTSDHMLGPLNVEKRVRKTKERRSKDPVGTLSTAEKVTKESLNATQDESTPSHVKRCYKMLKNKKENSRINLFEYVIDPSSYARSVENLFYTSFLIKEGRLVLEEDAEGYPAVRIKERLPNEPKERDIEKQKRNDTHQNHIIFQMDIPTWRKLIDKFNITEAFLSR